MPCGNLVSTEIYKCLKSLHESECESYRDNHFRKRHQGTCSWIFSHKNYRLWLENEDQSILWISGGPGFGKTVLSAVLSKELISDQHVSFDQECSVAYFFCDDKDDRLKTVYGLFTNILGQLLRQNPSALIHFSTEPVYNIDKERTEWTVEMLWRVFRRIVNDEKLKPMFLILDALGMLSSDWLSCTACLSSTRLTVTDECQETARKDLLVKLQDLFDVNHLNFIGKRLKIAITSRPQIPI
jgi:Cdc6-like AAA superfamily ATPase